MVEPSIGDFGLIENVDTTHISPRNASTTPLLIDNPKELEDIVKSHGVHMNADEV